MLTVRYPIAASGKEKASKATNKVAIFSRDPIDQGNNNNTNNNNHDNHNRTNIAHKGCRYRNADLAYILIGVNHSLSRHQLLPKSN